MAIGKRWHIEKYWQLRTAIKSQNVILKMTKNYTSLVIWQKQTIVIGILFWVLAGTCIGQTPKQLAQIRKATAALSLNELAKQYTLNASERKNLAIATAKSKGWALSFSHGKTTNYLVDIDQSGQPVYAGVDNLGSAQTIGIDKVWPGGSTGYNLSGKNYVAGLWDAGSALITHVELAGRVVSVDGATRDDHSTHCAGTIIGKGVNLQAKGGAYEAKLRSYNTSNPLPQLATEANNGAVAGNHSWSYKRGFQPGGLGYVWLGPAAGTVDPGYGYYSSIARQWDQAALNMPYFLNCKSAGNDRDNGPAPGETYTISATGARVTQPARNSANYRAPNGPYDCMANHSVSKNLLSVAAVSEIRNGYSNPAGVIMSSFSSWGPTDDGRIKPDVAAVGVAVLSSVSTSNTAYDTYDGTSMSTPSMTGACVLMQEQYAKKHHT